MEFSFGADTQSLHYTCLTHRKRQCVAVASCMYLCREVKKSNWKQMCLLSAEVSSDEIILSDASSTQCMIHSRWKSGNIVDYFGVNNVRKLKRDQFEVGVSSVFFSSLMDLKDALGQLAAFGVGHLVLLFVPFLSLAQGGICTFFFFLVHIQHKAVTQTERKLVQFKGCGWWTQQFPFLFQNETRWFFRVSSYFSFSFSRYSYLEPEKKSRGNEGSRGEGE